MMNKGERDYSIDFFRGIAVISILLIHTVFWSGTGYTPAYSKTLALLIDVPVFIFISGMSFNFSNSILKSIKGFCKLWGKWLVYIILFFSIVFIINRDQFTFTNIFNSLFFNVQNVTALSAVKSSLWFLYMYFIVVLICNSIIIIYRKHYDNLDNFKYIVLISLLFYIISKYNSAFIFLNSKIMLFNFIYLLGYYLYNFKMKNFITFICAFAVLLAIYMSFILLMNYDFNKMQEYKFSFDLFYLMHSSFSILLIFFFKDRIKVKKNNPLVITGRNALMFYFCNGISTSLLYFVLPKITISKWYFKLAAMFGINLVMTTTFTLIVSIAHKYIIKLLGKIKLNLIECKEDNM